MGSSDFTDPLVHRISDAELSRLMVTVAERLPAFWHSLREQEYFGHVFASETWLLRASTNELAAEAFSKYQFEAMKERLGVLRSPFDLGLTPQLPSYAAYQSEYIDQLRTEAKERGFRVVAEPLLRSFKIPLDDPLQQIEVSKINALHEQIAARFSPADSADFGSWTAQRRRQGLLRIYEGEFSARDFSVYARERGFSVFSRYFSQLGLHLAFVDLTTYAVDSSQLSFAVAFLNSPTDVRSDGWQFRAVAHYKLTDILPNANRMMSFSNRSFGELRLAAYCNAEFMQRFAQLIADVYAESMIADKGHIQSTKQLKPEKPV